MHRIAFRCDGDTEIGMGHIMECIHLAKVLLATGRCDVSFWTASGTIGSSVLASYGFQVIELDARCESAEMARLAVIWPCDMLIVSLKVREQAFFGFLQSLVPAILAIFDDGLGREWPGIHIVDYCVAQLSAKTAGQHRGPEYALLDPVLNEYRRGPGVTVRGCKRLFVNQGGSDPFGLSLKILNGLALAGIQQEVVLVLGPAVKPSLRERVHARVDHLPFRCVVKCALQPKQMWSLAAESDLAITAAGNTLYELCALGVPSIVVCHHDRHNAVAAAFEKRGAALNLGIGAQLQDRFIGESVRAVLSHWRLRRRLATNGRRLVDGLGCDRVADNVLSALRADS